MTDAHIPEFEDVPEKPGLKELASQLTDDVTAFVVAETNYLRAELDERVGYAHLAFYAVGFGWAMMLGTMITLPLAAIMMLGPFIGIVWAVITVSGGSLLVGRLLVWLGMRRIKASLKSREER